MKLKADVKTKTDNYILAEWFRFDKNFCQGMQTAK